MLDENGDGTDFSFAIPSAHRMAYSHMSIQVDEEGIIQEMEYSSYFSSGSEYGDMFSRPQECSYLKEEELDTLLYIVDKYTDEEYKRILRNEE